MREDTMKLIDEAIAAMKKVDRLVREEDWSSRDVYGGYHQGRRNTNINAALTALNNAWTTEATTPK